MLRSQICERDEKSLKSSEILNININSEINKVIQSKNQSAIKEKTVTS